MTNTISLLLYGASFTQAVSLKNNSYSSETALAQLEESVTLFTECLCFRYKDGFVDTSSPPDGIPDDPAATFSPIEDGGFIEDVGPDGKCENGIRKFQIPPVDPATDTDPTFNTDYHRYSQVTNQSCLYKIWMCACWASQTDGCLCARENPDDTVTMVKPKMGVCDAGEGPLLNPKAQDTGGYALKCAPNPCLACCACSRGICSGNGDPADDDDQGDANCCDCCGPDGGYTCGTYGGGGFGGGGGGFGGGGYGGGGGGRGGGGGGHGGSGGGGGVCIKQNVNTDEGCC